MCEQFEEVELLWRQEGAQLKKKKVKSGHIERTEDSLREKPKEKRRVLST